MTTDDVSTVNNVLRTCKKVAMLAHETSELTGLNLLPPTRTFQVSAVTVLFCYFTNFRESVPKITIFTLTTYQ